MYYMEALLAIAFLIGIAMYAKKSREQKHSKQCPRSGHYPCSPKVTNLVWKGAGGAPDYDYICPECRHEFNNSSF